MLEAIFKYCESAQSDPDWMKKPVEELAGLRTSEAGTYNEDDAELRELPEWE